ncbi:hypothetical protein [Blattabacterium cuenoti]|uniref:hypothetical protein n=1 Tax=Blattabacterium cuenoti TaxID=1653831 RepID=UPI00163C41A6|nr:hypothetical protein [Blattabacterium cuenoti]
MTIKFIGFLLFLIIFISGFWCIIFLSIFIIYWILSWLTNIIIEHYQYGKNIKEKN